jgi:hypothetical protein
MRIGFRHADARFPFFWETADQPAARWHRAGTGPVQYLADTPDGAWADFLRHEEITDVADLAGIARSLWAIELPDDVNDAEETALPEATGDRSSYVACQDHAAARRAEGVRMVRAPSAALISGAARGQVTNGGLHEGRDRDGHVWVLFGRYPTLTGWRVVERGAPPSRLVRLVRQLA